MRKGIYIIRPEEGSNNGGIDVESEPNTTAHPIVNKITVSGGGYLHL